MGLLSSIGSVFSGPANLASNLIGGYVDNYYNRKAAKNQYNYQMAMWEANNAYNTPKEQMERLEEAGLNKNLIYGSGSATHTATMASAPRVEPGRSGLNADTILKYQQADIFNQELLNLKATRDKIQAETDAIRAGIPEKESKSEKSQRNLDVYRETGLDPERGPVSSVLGNIAYEAKKLGSSIGEYIGDKAYQWFGGSRAQTPKAKAGNKAFYNLMKGRPVNDR